MTRLATKPKTAPATNPLFALPGVLDAVEKRDVAGAIEAMHRHLQVNVRHLSQEAEEAER